MDKVRADRERLLALANELVRLDPDAIPGMRVYDLKPHGDRFELLGEWDVGDGAEETWARAKAIYRSIADELSRAYILHE